MESSTHTPTHDLNRKDRWARSLDIAIVGLLVVVGAVAATTLAEGNALRLALTLPVLFFAPGYLLLEAFVPAATEVRRAWHALVAVGLSPVLVGLLALSTALIPGGFRPLSIIAVVTLGSLVLMGFAMYRRSVSYRPTAVPADRP